MTSSYLPISIFTTDANLIVQSWDSRMADMTGIGASVACGRALGTIIPDLEWRGLLVRFQRVLADGAIETLAPAFHQYLIPCPPSVPSKYFDHMQQRVTIAPIWESEVVVGILVMIEDVTPRIDYERDLGELLASPDEQVRWGAAMALGKNTEGGRLGARPLVGALQDSSWRVRQAATDSLALRLDSEIVSDLLRSLREQHQNLGILNSALQVLAIGNVDAVPALIEFLADADADLRIYSALALGTQHDSRAIPALISALADADTNVRYHAIEALGQLRALEAAEVLADIATSADFFLAFPALNAVLRIGEPAVAPRLVPLLKDELLGSVAAQVISAIGDDAAVMPLGLLLNDSEVAIGLIAQSIATICDRYESVYGEGGHIADLALRAIAATGRERLLAAARESGPGEIRAVALILSWLEGEEVERAMVGLLSNANVRALVAEALVRYGLRVGELLVGLLEGSDRETCQAAVEVLGRMGDTRAVPALMRLLAGDSELAVAAASALAKMGDRRAFEGLLDLLGHPDVAVRQAAIAALDSLGHPALPSHTAVLLSDPNPLVRESAVKIAGYFAFPECIDHLFACCHDPEERVRRAAIEHLPYLEENAPGEGSALGHRAFDTLTAALSQDTPKVRATAARALGEVDSERALPYLLTALQDGEPGVREGAARAIGKLTVGVAGVLSTEALNQSGFGALARVVQTDSVSAVRAASAEALGRLGGERAIPILASLLEVEEGGDVVRAALMALGQLQHSQALPPLLKALNSPNPERRADSVRALGERGDAAAVDSLQWIAASDADAQVVQAAIDSLCRIAASPALKVSDAAICALLELTVEPSRYEACCTALAQLGEAQLEMMPAASNPLSEIAQGLNNIRPEVRCATVQVLARLKKPRASELLAAALDDRDPTVRLAATTALGHLGNRSWQEKLATLARTDADPAVRRAAQKALHS